MYKTSVHLQEIIMTNYKLKGDEIGKLKTQQKVEIHLVKILPKYCLNVKTNKLIDSEYYHQFTDFGDEEYYFFNIDFTENYLKEEISNAGIDEVLNFDLSIIKNLPQITYEEMHRIIPFQNTIIVEITYEGSRSFEGDYDCDITTKLHGYFNSNKELIKV